MKKNILLCHFYLLLLPSFLKFSFAYQSCGLTPPKNPESCYMNNTGDNESCCYFKDTDGNYYCKLFNKTIINNYKDYNLTDFQCPDKYDKDLPGTPCGVPNPEEADSCKNSTVDVSHPCCFYQNGDFTKCFSIGKVGSSVLYTYDKDLIDCFAKYYNIDFLVFIIIMIIYL